MRALVTGGTGFLGTVLAGALERAGFEVRVLDVLPPQEPSTGREFVQADVRDPEAVRAAVRGCGVVVHNAALVPVTGSKLAEYRSVNVGGTEVTLAAAREEGAYVLHVSSTGMYGVPRELPITETTPFAPLDDYGVSKAEAEEVVRREREQGLTAAMLRPRSVLGRGRLGLFDVIFSRVRAGKRVPIFGRGDNRVQLGDADDFCDAAVAAIERRATGDYHVGTAAYGTVREDIQALIDHANTGAKLQPVPAWAIRAVLRPLDLIGRSPFTAWHYRGASASIYCDLSHTIAELDWHPRHSNAEALARAYDDYVARPERVGESVHRSPLAGALARALRG